MHSSDNNSDEGHLRTPIVCVMGHVDHGKTTLLDTIRGTTVADKEAGAITQHIGATEVPVTVINELCKQLMRQEFKVPGLLFIDTPGHHAFTTLRSRGGALADLAVMIVDAKDGFQPQTHEVLRILRRFKTPFVVAMNKIDMLPGWDSQERTPFIISYKQQSERVQQALDGRIYEIIGELHGGGFDSDRYDRIKDFQKAIGVVPISAVTGEGIPDLLMVLLGLAQRFLEKSLHYHETAAGAGSVLEVKEAKGLGTTIDVILYDGRIKIGDTIVLGSRDEPVVTRVRALLEPRPMAEIRLEDEFERVDMVTAAAGVKIAAPNLEQVIPGVPIRVVENTDDLDQITEEIRSELSQLAVETDNVGVVVKADTLGSLEALVNELRSADISVQKADIGDVSKRDVVDAMTTKDPFLSVIMAFNVDILPDAMDEIIAGDVPVFSDDVVYRVVGSYEEWMEEKEAVLRGDQLDTLIRSATFQILPDYVFRMSNPAIVGVRILGGVLKPSAPLIKEDGSRAGIVKQIQSGGENIDKATLGEEVAVSIEGVTVGRQIKENDILLTDIPEKDIKLLEYDFRDELSSDEQDALEKFLDIKRKDNPFWGK